MKTLKKIPLLAGLLIMASSFNLSPGGEGFEVYLNQKLMVQQYGNEMNHVSSLSLDRAAPSDKLVIKYYHCGRSGKNRIILVKDMNEKTVKTFRYPDTTPLTAMEVPLKDIVTYKDYKPLKVFYSSDQLPKGRVLLELKMTGTALASR